jgi:soluble lytic murein transglycosylase
VLGISEGEAAERLRRGDTGFLLAPEAGRAELENLAKIHPSAPFYAGLVLKDPLPAAAQILFETSLASPNALVREAAAREIFGFLFRGEALPAPLLDRLQKEAPDLWNKTLGLFTGPDPRQAALSLFFSPQNGLPHEALPYMMEEFRRRGPGFSPPEEAAIEGHLAVSRSSFAEGLLFFRTLLEEHRALFFQYPELLNDLGRCFQYAAAGDEGTDLFLAWEQDLAGEAGEGPDVTPGAREGIRFRLLFFAGRISRQRGNLSRGAELFARALPFAPDAVQEDACIWYILDAALQSAPGQAASLTAASMPRWNDGAYFSDILDRLAQYLTVNRKWGDLAALLDRMREPGRGEANGPAVAQYAYILGRALSQRLYRLPGEDGDGGREAAETGGEAFFRLAYEAPGASLYYRALSASALKKPLRDLLARPARERSGGTGGRDRDRDRERMEFLRGFFEYGAAPFALPYILDQKEELSAGEIRALAGALEKAGRYPEAIRLVSAALDRRDYEPVRADWELFYPRPFQKLIEENAREAGLRRELLFALVRTESAFQPDIVSRAGAVGLAQLMPATAADMAGRIRRRGGPDDTEPGEPDLRDPEVNVHLGAVYLSYLTGRLESPFLAILSYNGGMNRVRRWRNGERNLPEDLFLETIPYAETREYGRKVLSAALIYGYLYYDLKPEDFFSDIFKDD